MTILKTFDETGREIGSHDVTIDEDNFQLYIDQYGPDRAAGYKDAFADMVKQITVLLTRTDPYGVWGVSDQVAGRRIEKLHHKNSLTLEKILQILPDPKLKP